MAEQSQARSKLQNLVERAEQMLVSESGFYTEGTGLALIDIVTVAKRVLAGEHALPFVRSREFYRPREDEDILFATTRFTLAPSYSSSEEIGNLYGLEPALKWFEQQNMRGKGADWLKKKAGFVIDQAEELLGSATLGGDVGNYNPVAGGQLHSAVERVKQETSNLSAINEESLTFAIVNCVNRIRDFRFSRILRTDVDILSNLYLTKGDLQKLKEAAKRDEIISNQCRRIRELADNYSLAYIEKASLLMQAKMDYNHINQEFYVWSSTDKMINFTAPKRAKFAELTLVLPADENESDGLGHVWIDNLEIHSASGSSLEIWNGGFDEGEEGSPYHWKPVTLKGNPEFRWEDEYPYCGGGVRPSASGVNSSPPVGLPAQEGQVCRSLYICNPTEQDEGAWVYNNKIAIKGGEGYTLTFAAKLDGKFKNGLRTVITFKDEAGVLLGEFENVFNRKSSLPNSSFQLTMQCDAIQYAFTDDVNYAMKTKKEMLYNLHDFCQGAEHWLVTNERPQGSDSYGAVQGGRLLCSLAVSYSLIKQADVFTQEEKENFYSLLEYMLRYMMDLRDRSELTPYEAQYGASNWQTDMCAGTGYLMMAMEDFPNRKTWLYNANKVLKSQLNLNLNPDHSWPESIRYHHAALERFAGYAKVLNHVLAENWFQDTPLSNMFDYSIQLQTPGYQFFDGHIGTPPFGDHALGGGSEFGSYPIYLEDIEKIDKNLADRMYQSWEQAGRPLKGIWGEAVVLENLLGVGKSYVPANQLELNSTKNFSDAGIYVFRKNPFSTAQSYFAIMSSPKPVGHGHLDQGAFILYKNSVPLVMDSGIEGYFDSSTSWHISSYSHSCMQFSTRKIHRKVSTGAINLSAGTYSLERGWVDTPKTSRVLDCTIGTDIESISIEIMNPEGKGRHIREVHYIKAFDLYIIRDSVKDFEGEVIFNLPIAASTSVISGQRVLSEGYYEVVLETVFLSKLNRIWLDKGRTTRFFPSEETIPTMEYIRAVADAKEGFVTVLYPHAKGQKRLKISSQYENNIIISTEEFQVNIRTLNDNFVINPLN